MIGYFGAGTDVDVNKYPVLTYTEATATTDTTIASATYALLNNMTITPAAGTYLVWFSSSCLNDTNGAITYYSVFSGGSQVSHTERRATSLITAIVALNQPSEIPVATQCLVTVNGSQAIEIRWKSSAGTSTSHARTLNILKVAS